MSLETINNRFPDPKTETVTYEEAAKIARTMIEDRATWFKLLIDQMQAAGLDAEDVARKAIRQFGCMKSNKMSPTTSMEEFMTQFAGKLVNEVFAMKVVELSEERSVIEFHYCPLVESWKKMGAGAEEVDRLCEWAVEGDYGVMTNFPDFAFDPELRIAAGDAHCKMVFSRKRVGA